MENPRLVLLKRLGISTLTILGVISILVLLFTLVAGQMGTMFFAFLAGSLGAETSIIRRMPKLNDDQIKRLIASWWSLVIPLIAGSLMAGFLYLAFMAGILTGDGGQGLFTSNLFPNFTEPSVGDMLNMEIVLQIRPVSIADFGKLLVWCFLAGYSERLVPNLLKALEDRGAGDKS